MSRDPVILSSGLMAARWFFRIHVGTVEKVENGRTHRSVGNSRAILATRKQRHPIGYYEIYVTYVLKSNTKKGLWLFVLH